MSTAMSAATLTTIRERAHQGPDGDRVFLVGCQLGHNGREAVEAFPIAEREVLADSHCPGPLRDARIADRLIELVNERTNAPQLEAVES